MHPVSAFLLTNPVSALEAHGIYARWSTANPRKLTLNYDQIEARDGDELVELCRGAVFRQVSGERGEAGEYEILARPMRRFYNLGAGAAAPIDWTTARWEEKLDGTLCIVYWDPDLDDTCVATRNVPDADIPNTHGDTFADLFWRHVDTPTFVEGRTYCYELTGPDNQIVVPYDDWRVTQLACIDNATGEEDPRSHVRTFAFGSMEAAKAWLETQPGHTLEGFVVRDAANRRVKVKSSQYLAVARVMTASGSDAGLVEIILSGTMDDVRELLPAPRVARADVFAERIRAWAHRLDHLATELRAEPDRKTVALRVQASEDAQWMGALMSMWQGKADNVTGWLAGMKKNGVIPDSIIGKIAEHVCGVGA